MKRIYQTLLLALSLSCGMAQTAFWTPTTYKGAFDCTAPMWTNGWTNWDPQNTNYPSPTMTITSNITSNTTWATGQTVLLQGQIYVKNNSILTIQPGVVVLGSKAVAGSGLFITTGSKIMAVGTASMPIVFTSDQPPGSRSLGDWGGISLMGLAATNASLGINNIEGLAPSPDTQYGGGASPNNNDNSGSMQYVRVEYSGYVYAANKEINGITLGAIGGATTLDHIQVSYSNDDGYEWFGGTVNAKYLVSFRNLDDDFDTDNGYQGNIQFGLIVRDPALADVPSVSTSEGFESDNDPTGSAATPITRPIFSNITFIGPYRGNSATAIASGYRRGAHLRRNCQTNIFNSIFMDYKTAGVMIDGTACENNATAMTLNYQHNIVASTAGTTSKSCELVASSSFPSTVWFSLGGNDSTLIASATTPTILVTPYNYLAPDYRPVCSNAAVTSGASFSNTAFATGGILGVQDIDRSLTVIGLYPNPTSNETSLFINAEKSLPINVQVYSVTGQLVAVPYTQYTIETGTNSLPLATGNLSSGIYFVKLQYGTKNETIKLVVNK
jgi:hypothetical protein